MRIQDVIRERPTKNKLREHISHVTKKNILRHKEIVSHNAYVYTYIYNV